jgi:hypothetical protein
MPDEPTPETISLQTAIARLTTQPAPVTQSGRVITSDTNNDPMAALLDEVEQTVLRRHLRFTNNHGMHLHLEAADRRILRVNKHHTLTDENLEVGHADAGSLDRCRAIIEEFCLTARTIAVRSTIVPHAVDDAHLGVLATEFARPTVPYEAVLSNPKYLDGLDRVVLAYRVKNDSGLVKTWGNTDLIARFADCTTPAVVKQNETVLWIDTKSKGLLIGTSIQNDSVIYFAAETENLEKLRAHFLDNA